MLTEICNILGPESRHRTTLTPGAYHQLLSWDIAPSKIDGLQSLISQFEYARIPDRLRLLTRQTAYFDPATDTLTIPHLHDNSGHLTGQCGPLTRQLLTILLTTDYLGQLNHRPPHHPDRLQACLVTGQSATHFTDELACHAWVALKRQRDALNRDLVYLDPSFQTIMTATESGYTPQSIIIHPRQFTASTTTSFAIGTLTHPGEDDYVSTLKSKSVIGATDDREYVVCLSFARHEGSPRIHPVIVAIDYTGHRGYHTFPLPHTDSPALISFNFPQPLLPSTRDNLFASLAAAQKFRITAYPMPEIYHHQQTVKFDPAPSSLPSALIESLKHYVPRI